MKPRPSMSPDELRECWCGDSVTSSDPDISFCEPCRAYLLAQQVPDTDGTICYERPGTDGLRGGRR